MFDGVKPFKITKPIRLITLFSGYDSQALSLKYLGIPFEHYKTSEWAIKSIQALKDLHFSNDNTDYSGNMTIAEVKAWLSGRISSDYSTPLNNKQIERLSEKEARKIYNNMQATHNLGSIMAINGNDLQIVDTDKFTYVLTYSFPCLTADSLILTKDGYKPIVDIKVGDYVLTKSNTWQRVAKKFSNGIHKTFYVQGMNFENIHCTANHKFYVRSKFYKGHKQIRSFTEPTFKEVKDITRNDYFGVPVIQIEKSFYTDDLDFWYMIGYYLGDGWLSKNRTDICLACNEKKFEKLQSRLLKEKWKWTCYFSSTCGRFRFSNQNIYKFIQKYIGTGCNKKNISADILNLPKQQLQSLFEGYLDSDGCVINGKMQFSTVNRQMAYGFSAIINKLYHRAVSFNKNKVKPQKVIQGRIVNQREWYLLRFNPKNSKQDKAFYENGYIWYPFNKIEQGGDEFVFNMEIENDHSYIVQSCISKNCQDLSTAGKGAGMEKGSGTRSGLLWEVERLLKETKELPQVLLMENVPEVIGSKNIKHFAKWVEFLDNLGYHSKWGLLNAKDFGIAQNRNRCFMVSVLGDYYYDMPTGFKLEYVLKDFLDKNVDESYYLKDETIRSLNLHKERHEAQGHGFGWKPSNGGVSLTQLKPKADIDRKVTLLLSNQRRRIEKVGTKVANTIMARDYKGFGNQSMNAVMEVPPCEIERTE